MKNKSLILFPLIIGLSLVACSKTSSDSLSYPEELSISIKETGVKELRNPENLSHSITVEEYRSESFKTFTAKMNAFSSKLSEHMNKSEYQSGNNFAFSPLSIELCLGLAIRASNGETRQELLNLVDMDYETFNTNYKLFFNYLYHSNKNNMDYITAQLLLANSIWIDDEADLKDDCLDSLKDDYYCYSFNADFNKHNKEANQAIREFVKQATKGLIDQDLGLTTETLFVLMNTLYIKDIWNEDGHDLSYVSSEYKFKNSDGTFSDKQLLGGYHNSGKAMITDDYSSFYTKTNNGYYIYFIKANDNKNIKDVFNENTINYVIDHKNYVYQDAEKLERYHTNCYFPEYEANSDIDLQKVFKEEFNVVTLFDRNRCDLSNLSNSPVYCSDFRHIAKLNVNKSGIEGAAVTYMAYAGAAGPDEYKDVYETFVVDQEFGFVMTFNQSIVFSGVVTNID